MDNDTLLIYEPETVAHPGETVVEYLEFNEWSQRDLARRTGLTPKTISEICNGKTPITPTTALAFEKVLGRPARFWISLQRQFDEAEARQRAALKFDLWKDWASKFPCSEMERYGWLKTEGTKQSIVESLLTFFGVSSPDSWESVWKANNVAYRQTRKFHTSDEAVSTWVRASELLAAEVEVEEFNENLLRSSLDELRHQTRKRPENGIPKVQALCAAAGVALVFVPELRRTGISGCARWLSEKKALIGLTLRYKWEDQVWFTFFHELAHILLHKKELSFVLDNAATDLTDGVIDPQMQKNEEEANRFAADTLIPPESLFRFIQKGEFSTGDILAFSKAVGISPGIVVGRLQHERILKPSQGNELKQRFVGHTSDDV